MKVLLTGAAGQLGQALIAQTPRFLLGNPVELIACTRLELDLSNSDACCKLIKNQRPDWVINAGAYTQVDQAEEEPELANAVNAGAPAAFARSLGDYGGKLVQLSTDFVFNGNSGSPYKVDSKQNPLGVYALTKAKGEREALKLPGARLLRTSWVYGPLGNNFCLTMLRLHAMKAERRESIGVIGDQVGCPTATHTLATACWKILELDCYSEPPIIFHWSDAGVSSWYDFAVAIGELGVKAGILKEAAFVKPIRTKDYSTLASRPSYSLLDCASSYQSLDLEPVHWRIALNEVMRQLSKC